MCSVVIIEVKMSENNFKSVACHNFRQGWSEQYASCLITTHTTLVFAFTLYMNTRTFISVIFADHHNTMTLSCAWFCHLRSNLLLCIQIGFVDRYLHEAESYIMLQALRMLLSWTVNSIVRLTIKGEMVG
jgi:hypothetical protein